MKVITTLSDSAIVTKLNVHMQVKQAISKLKEHDILSRIRLSDKNLGLFLPSSRYPSMAPGGNPGTPTRASVPPGGLQRNSLSYPSGGDTSPNSSPSVSSAASASPVLLDPELYLWHYGISNGVCFLSFLSFFSPFVLIVFIALVIRIFLPSSQ